MGVDNTSLKEATQTVAKLDALSIATENTTTPTHTKSDSSSNETPNIVVNPTPDTVSPATTPQENPSKIMEDAESNPMQPIVDDGKPFVEL